MKREKKTPSENERQEKGNIQKLCNALGDTQKLCNALHEGGGHRFCYIFLFKILKRKKKRYIRGRGARIPM